MLASVLPATLIATVRLPRISWVAWLGAVSYSLYLVHYPVSVRVVNLAGRLPQTFAMELATVAVAFAVSIVVAYVLYVLVERWSRQLASTISYCADDRTRHATLSTYTQARK